MPDVYKTTDNQNFTVPGTSPSQINQLVWQGLPGKYIAAADDGLYTTIDGGATWGVLRPNTEFATTLPGGAVPRQLAFSIGPNGGGNCGPIGSTCQAFPVTFAAWNNTGGAVTPFNGFTLQSEENNIAGIQTLADAFKGTNQDFLEYVISGGSSNSAVVQNNLSWDEDGTIRTIILAVVSRGSTDYPTVPAPNHGEMSNWNLIDTVVFGNNSRLSVFTARWDDTTLLPLTISFDEVQEAITFCVRVFTGVTVSSPVISSRSAYGIPQGDMTFDIGINFAAPYTGDNHTWSVDDIDGGAGEGLEAGAAAIALEVQFCPVQNAYAISFIAVLPGNSGPGGASFNGIDSQGLWFTQQYNNNANGPGFYSAIKEGNNAWGATQSDFYGPLADEESGPATSIVLPGIQTINADDVIIVAVVAHLVGALVNPTISDSQGLTWTFQNFHGPPAGLGMYVWTAKANAAVVASGTDVTIDYGAETRNAITALAVALRNSSNPDSPVTGYGFGAFAGSGSGTEDTPVTGDAIFSPDSDHIWNMNDFTQSLVIAMSVQ